MGSTGTGNSALDLSIMVLCVGRIYKSNSVMGVAVLKYIGNEHVVYDYYAEIEELFKQNRPAECTKLIKDFKDTYTATPFLYEPGEV